MSCSFQITQSFCGSPSLLFCDLRRPKMPILNKQARYLYEGGGILKYFISLLNWESYAAPTWKHLDRLGKFLVGERSIDQMKQIPRIQGILHQLKLVALKKLNPAQRSRLHDETMVKMEYNQGICPFLLYFSTFCG